MSSETHSPADDLVYDLVAIQYRALKAATTYDRYLQDAEGHDDVKQFFTQCQEQDAQRALQCHRLLGSITKGGDLTAS